MMTKMATVTALTPNPSPAGRGEQAAEREATYQAALKLVARIDEDLVRGIRHYRTKQGLLLTTLDEVVRAIIDSNLEVTSWQN